MTVIIIVFLAGLVAARAAEPAPPGRPPAVDLRLMGDQVSLRADNAPLSAVLKQFRQWGVTVELQPDSDPVLSVRMEAVDTETALAAILGSHDYLLIWRVIPGPVGPLPKLHAIRVVGAGAPSGSMVAAVAAGPLSEQLLSLTSYPGIPGALVVRDELLLRVNPGVSMPEFKRLLDQVHGGVVDGNALVGVYRIRLRPYTNLQNVIDQLSRHPLVSRVEPHWAWTVPVWQTPDGTAPQLGSPTGAGRLRPVKGLDQVAVPGSAVAVLDTGIREGARWRSELQAAFGLDGTAGPGHDPDGHGTWMTGLAGGFLSPLGAGVDPPDHVPPPQVMSLSVFNDQGAAPLFAILQSIERAVESGAGVMSLSWGGPQNSRFLEEALVWARQQGVVVLAAAGNEPTGEPVYPAALPAVLAVGALRPDGQRWEPSNHGAFVALAAPGFAADPGDPAAAAGLMAGTSVATAYAAGVFARFRALHPDRSVDEVVAFFLRELTPPAGAEPFSVGGRLDEAAIRRLFGD